MLVLATGDVLLHGMGSKLGGGRLRRHQWRLRKAILYVVEAVQLADPEIPEGGIGNV